jgi:hypothetical protein
MMTMMGHGDGLEQLRAIDALVLLIIQLEYPIVVPQELKL